VAAAQQRTPARDERSIRSESSGVQRQELMPGAMPFQLAHVPEPLRIEFALQQ